MWGKGESRISKVEQGVREVVQSVRYTHRGSGSNVYVVTAVVRECRSNVKGTEGVAVPGFACKGSNMRVAELASRVNGVGTKVTGFAEKAMVGRCRVVKLGGLEVVQGEFNEGEESVPEIKGEGDVD